MLKAGFAEIDITPETGSRKLGWIGEIIGQKVLDPLFARVAILESGNQALAWVQMDVLSAPASLVKRIRGRLKADYGFAGDRVMVAATHNHAGPAVANDGAVCKDESYIQTLCLRVSMAFEMALAAREMAEIGFGKDVNLEVAHNRRVVMLDGLVRTHGDLSDPAALRLEGPEDGDLKLMVVRSKKTQLLLGLMVNYACHPTHHGGDEWLSAGWPGVMAKMLKLHDVPVTIFLNGAAGNQSTEDPHQGGKDREMDDCGNILAGQCTRMLKEMTFTDRIHLEVRNLTVSLPFRDPTEEQVHGTVRGAQRFMATKYYDDEMPALLAEIKAMGTQPAELQAFIMGDQVMVTLPGEPFAELGLKIKELTSPRNVWVVGYANGMVGYIPHKEAFERGGYETTFCGGSKLAPEAGDMLVEAAVGLVKGS